MNGEYENQAWLTNWLRLKVKQERKEFNEITREEAKKNIKTLAFIQLKLKGKVVIENFPDLTQLNLSNNEFEEIIIRNCPDLKLVQVAHNKLTKLKIENCPSVKEIYTHNNQLTKWDVDVEDLKSKNLRVISYSDNPLTVEEKDRLDALGLKDTAMKSRVDGPAQDYLDAKYPLDKRGEVEKLDLSNLGLQGDLDLEGFTNLKSLDCSGNELTNLDISECENLKYLDASNNSIEEPDFLEGSELETIILNHNKLTYFDYFDSLSDSLKFLSLVANQLGEIVPSVGTYGYLDVTGYKKLESLFCGVNELKTLDLSENLNLKDLSCYRNYIKKLNLTHLENLESLTCHHSYNVERDGILDLNNLKNLKELYCANCEIVELNLNGCDSLKILDCAENGMRKLEISNLKNLNVLSCKENKLRELHIIDCDNLEYLDCSGQMKLMPTVINISNSFDNLKELFFDEKDAFPIERILKLDNIGVFKSKKIDGKTIYYMEEIDVLSLRNTERIKNILANPNNYSLDDLLNITKEQLCGVEKELRDELIKLIKKKLKKKKRNFSPKAENQIQQAITIVKDYWKSKDLANTSLEEVLGSDWANGFANKESAIEINQYMELLKSEIDYWVKLSKNKEEQEQNKENIPPQEEKKRKTLPPEEDFLKLQQKISQLEAGNQTQLEQIRQEIINSQLSEEQKQELLRQLEGSTKKTTNNEVASPSSTPLYYYWGWAFVIVGWIVLASLIILSLRMEKKKKIKFANTKT